MIDLDIKLFEFERVMVATTSASVGLPLAAALLLLLLLLLPICNASMAKGALSEEPATATSGEKRGGIILIPGLGRVDRLQLVTHNLFYLEQYVTHQSSPVIV